MLAACPVCDPMENKLEFTPQTDSSLQRKLESKAPLEIVTLDINMCTHMCVRTQAHQKCSAGNSSEPVKTQPGEQSVQPAPGCGV